MNAIERFGQPGRLAQVRQRLVGMGTILVLCLVIYGAALGLLWTTFERVP